MKSLRNVQIFMKVMQVICLVLFIIFIIGAAGTLIALITLPFIQDVVVEEGNTFC